MSLRSIHHAGISRTVDTDVFYIIREQLKTLGAKDALAYLRIVAPI